LDLVVSLSLGCTFDPCLNLVAHLPLNEQRPPTKGVNNVVADALSRMKMTEKDFSPEVFAGEKVKQTFPLSYKLLAEMQAKDKKLQK
jgi:hypothetical protein